MPALTADLVRRRVNVIAADHPKWKTGDIAEAMSFTKSRGSAGRHSWTETILMANIAPQFGRLLRPMWVSVAKNLTSWAAVGTIVALTGFGPEHWFAAAFRYV